MAAPWTPIVFGASRPCAGLCRCCESGSRLSSFANRWSSRWPRQSKRNLSNLQFNLRNLCQAVGSQPSTPLQGIPTTGVWMIRRTQQLGTAQAKYERPFRTKWTRYLHRSLDEGSSSVSDMFKRCLVLDKFVSLNGFPSENRLSRWNEHCCLSYRWKESHQCFFLLQRKHLHHLDLGVTLRDENPTGGRPQGQAVSAAHTTRNRPLGVSSYFLGYGTNRCCCHSPTLHKSWTRLLYPNDYIVIQAILELWILSDMCDAGEEWPPNIS